MQDVEDRVKVEAAFQNPRIEAHAQMHGHEVRHRFYTTCSRAHSRRMTTPSMTWPAGTSSWSPARARVSSRWPAVAPRWWVVTSLTK